MNKDKRSADLKVVLDLLSDFQSGNFSKTLPSCEDPSLIPLFNKLSETSEILKAQAQAQELFHQSADAIMTLAPPSWKFTGCNRAALSFFVVPSEKEFIQLGHWNLSPEFQADGELSSTKAQRAILRAMNEGQAFFEWNHQTLSGKVVPCTVLLSRINSAGSTYLQATVRDVSIENEILQNLQSRTEELNSFFEVSVDLLCIAGADGSFKKVNSAFTQVLGYSKQELLSQTIASLIHPEDLEMAVRETTKLRSLGKTGRFEARFRKKDSGYKLLDWSIAPDPKSEIFYASARDITLERQKELETATVLNTMANGLVIHSSQGNIESFNSAALSILGLTEDQLIGRTSMDPQWKSLRKDRSPFPGEEHPAMLALRSGKEVRGTLMGLTLPSQEERWIKINAVPFESPSGRRVACTFSDITEEVRSNTDIEHIFSHSIDLMCIASTDGTFKKVNPSFAKILGFTEHELISKPFLDFIHPEDIASTNEIVTTLGQGVPLINFENRYRTKSGDYRRISWVCEPDTKTGLLYATGRDVTSLRNSEYRNRQILDAIDKSAIVAFTDLTGSITHVNENFCKISGYSEAELLGKNHRILNSGRHPKSFFQNMWAQLNAGKTWTGDIENRSKTGEHYHVRSLLSPLKNIDGQIEQFMAIRFDITEQKNTEIEREALTKFLEVVLDNVPSMIFVKDYKDNLGFSMLNKAGEQLLGVKKEQMIGKNDHDFFPKEQADFFQEKDKQVFAEGKVLKISKEEINTSIGKRILQTYKVPTYDANHEPHLLIGISNDITDECNMRDALDLERARSLKNAKLASLGEMSAGIAHEINNPLAIISGALDLLVRHGDDPEKRASKVSSIRRSCERITRIVSGLRKFSRSGDKSHFEFHSLEKIIQESLTLSEAKAKRHDTPISVSGKIQSLIYCDEVEIEQVLVNLVNNAIDAVKPLSEKWVKLEIAEEEDSILLKITDSGPGIPKETRNRLFEPFFTTKNVGEGTGLGLSITKGILDEHKATISVLDTCPNTCFEIRFPKAKPKVSVA